MLIISGSQLEGTVQEVENLRKEVDKLKHCGETAWTECDINTSHIVWRFDCSSNFAWLASFVSLVLIFRYILNLANETKLGNQMMIDVFRFLLNSTTEAITRDTAQLGN